MKRKALLAAALFIACLLTAVLSCGCMNLTPGNITSLFENVAEGGKFDKDSGSAGEEFTYSFAAETTFNTLVLKEKEEKITSFEVYANGALIYASDYVGAYKYCAFPAVSAGSVTIKVTAADGAFEFTALEAYMITSTHTPDFEVMAYITADSAYKLDVDAYRKNAETVTQFNLIGSLYFDIDGNLRFYDYAEENSVPGLTDSSDSGDEIGAEIFGGALENIRKMNPDATVVVTVLGNKDLTGDGVTDVQERHNKAMSGERGKRLISNIVKLLDDYGLDGVSFDYEYPTLSKSFRIYRNFLGDLKDALPSEKLLTAALSEWNTGIGKNSKPMMKMLDGIEMMAYDLFDSRGCHSTFYSAYTVTANALAKGTPKDRLHLGLPFYSRPVTEGDYWGAYKDISDKTDKFQNVIEEDCYGLEGNFLGRLPCYFNGWQMIYDKTCYAIDSGIGGVMIWHFAYDSSDPEKSLSGAIRAAIDSRS